MREKFIRFMNGRNGMDELARAESWVVMILLLVSIFTRSAILDILAIGLMIHMYFRVFSRNVNKRYAENQKFLNARYEWTVKAERRKKRFAQRKQCSKLIAEASAPACCENASPRFWRTSSAETALSKRIT